MSAYEVTHTSLYYRTDDSRHRVVLVIITGPDGEFSYWFRTPEPDETADHSRAIFYSVTSTDGRAPRRRVGFTLAARAAEDRIARDDERGEPCGAGCAGPVA